MKFVDDDDDALSGNTFLHCLCFTLYGCVLVTTSAAKLLEALAGTGGTD